MSFEILVVFIPKEGLAGGAQPILWYENNKDLKRHVFAAFSWLVDGLCVIISTSTDEPHFQTNSWDVSAYLPLKPATFSLHQMNGEIFRRLKQWVDFFYLWTTFVVKGENPVTDWVKYEKYGPHYSFREEIWLCFSYPAVSNSHYRSSRSGAYADSGLQVWLLGSDPVPEQSIFVVWTGNTLPDIYTLISVTGSGHIRYKKRRLPYKIKDKSSCQSKLLRYMAAGHIYFISQRHGMLKKCKPIKWMGSGHLFYLQNTFSKCLPLSLHAYSSGHLPMATQLLWNMRSGHIKVKKGTHHLFYMAIHRHTTESVHAHGFLFFPLIVQKCFLDSAALSKTPPTVELSFLIGIHYSVSVNPCMWTPVMNVSDSEWEPSQLICFVCSN